jgi:hypothetical protein
MKKNLFIVLIIGSQMALAGVNKVMSSDDFKKEIQQSLNSVTHGELQGLGGGCQLNLDKKADGNSLVEIVTESGLHFSVPINKANRVKANIEESSDGSFSKTFYFGIGNQLQLVHADDAYDSATLTDGTTKLTCLVEY